MDKSPLIELIGVEKTFGRVQALSNINLKLYEGEIVSLVGDNGAGKTTLTKIISGTESADDGAKIIAWSRTKKLERCQGKKIGHRDSASK